MTNGNEIDNAPCDDFGNHQDWTMLDNGQIELGTTGDCIGVSGGNTASGSKAVLWSCSGVATNQQWRVTGWGELQEANSGKCLDQPTVTSPVPPLEIEPCSTDGAYSYVTPFDLPATTGEIAMQGSGGQCLTIESIPNPEQAGARISTVGAATCSGSTSTQEWTLESNGNIQLEGSSTCLSAALIPDENPALYTGAPQTCWTSSSEDMQQWIIESDGELFLNNGGTLAGYSLATEAGDDKSVFVLNGVGSNWNFP